MGQVHSAERGLCQLEEVRRRCSADPLLVRKLAQHIVSLHALPRIYSFSRVISFGALLRFLARTFGESRGGDTYAFARGRLMTSPRFPTLALRAKEKLVVLVPAPAVVVAPEPQAKGSAPLPVHISIRGEVSGRQEDDPMHFRLDDGVAAEGRAERVPKAATPGGRVGGVLSLVGGGAGLAVSRGFAEESTALVEAGLGKEAAEAWGRCLLDLDSLFAAAWRETEAPRAATKQRDERDARSLLAFRPVDCPRAERMWQGEAGDEAGDEAGAEAGAEAEEETVPEVAEEETAAGEAETETAASEAETETETETTAGEAEEAAGEAEMETAAGEADAETAASEAEMETTAGEADAETVGGEADVVAAEPRALWDRTAKRSPQGEAKVETAAGAGRGEAVAAVGGERLRRMGAKALAAWMAEREEAAGELGWRGRGPVSWLELLLVFGGMAGGEEVQARLRREGIKVAVDADGLPVLPREFTPALIERFSGVLSGMRERVRGGSFEVAGGPEGMDVFPVLLQAVREADVEAIVRRVRGSEGDVGRVIMRETRERQRRMVEGLDAVFAAVPVRDWPELARQFCALVASRFPQLRLTLIERLPARLLLALLFEPEAGPRLALLPGDTLPEALAALPEIRGPHSSLLAALEEEAGDAADSALRKGWMGLLAVYYRLERERAAEGSDTSRLAFSILIELLRRPFGPVSAAQFSEKVAKMRAPIQAFVDEARRKVQAIRDEAKRKQANEIVRQKMTVLLTQILAIDSFEKRMLSSGL